MIGMTIIHTTHNIQRLRTCMLTAIIIISTISIIIVVVIMIGDVCIIIIMITNPIVYDCHSRWLVGKVGFQVACRVRCGTVP